MTGNSRAIPEGFHTASPYLIVPDAERAIAFYKQAFGASDLMQVVDGSGRIRSAEIKIGDSPIMIGTHPDMVNNKTVTLDNLPQVSVYLYVENVDVMFAQAISAGAKKLYDVTDQFYGNREGGIVDPFGVVWWLATQIEALPVDEIQRRSDAMIKPQSR